MRRPPLRQLLPADFELWYIAIFASLLVLAGNGQLILERLGIIGSTKLIGRQVSTRLDWGLNVLQSYRFTANAVNLLVWGVVGLVIYSLLESSIRRLHTLAFHREFNSARYIHPQGYSAESFWEEIAINALLGFMLLVAMFSGSILYAVIAIPTGFTLVQRFIVRPGPVNTLELIAGLALVFTTTTVMYMLIRAVVRHHRISQFVE